MASLDEKVNASLDLFRRLPPKDVERNLAQLHDFAGEEVWEEVLNSVDQPLKAKRDTSSGDKIFLACEYNRDGDSHRSPWSNSYFPPSDGGLVPSENLRKLEIEANEAFDEYRKQHFEAGSYSSVYFWDVDQPQSLFAGVVLIKKMVEVGDGQMRGCWDSIHTIDAYKKSAKHVHYKLVSSIALWLQTEDGGKFSLMGNLTRKAETNEQLTGNGSEHNAQHICHIGTMVEQLEFTMRSSLEHLYFTKMKYALNSTRRLTPGSDDNVKVALPEMGVVPKADAGDE